MPTKAQLLKELGELATAQQLSGMIRSIKDEIKQKENREDELKKHLNDKQSKRSSKQPDAIHGHSDREGWFDDEHFPYVNKNWKGKDAFVKKLREIELQIGENPDLAENQYRCIARNWFDGGNVSCGTYTSKKHKISWFRHLMHDVVNHNVQPSKQFITFVTNYGKKATTTKKTTKKSTKKKN
jgi:hypothetical protein